jgi:peptidoglycan hydrolase CwlO-like protein
MGYGLIAAVLTLASLWVVGAMTLGTQKTNSLVSWSWNRVRSDANSQVPVEVEIERLRHEINQLSPDMKKVISEIAEETVAVKNLRKDVDQHEATLASHKADLLTVSKQIETGTYPILYKDRSYNEVQARDKVSREFDLYKRSAGDLKFKKELLEAKETSLEKAKENLRAMKGQKRELEVQLAKLESQAKALKVAQTNSKFQFDDSRMAEIKKSLQELDDRLAIENEKLRLTEDFGGVDGRPAPQKESTKDITQEVRDYFSENGKTKAVAEQK